MDVELQIIKHLARDAQSTVSVIDDYCAIYKDLFSEVRNYECFKYLHLGERKKVGEISVETNFHGRSLTSQLIQPKILKSSRR